MKRTLAFVTIALSIAAINKDVYAINSSELVYHDASTLPLIGTLAPDASKAYSRLPDSLESQTRKDVWDLGQDPAGMAIRFRSDASAIGVKFTSLRKFAMNHMTATGIRGLDLYAMTEAGKWTTVGSVRPSLGDKSTRTLVISDMTPKMREYMLYLPLYDGVDSVYIGVDSTAVVLPPLANTPRRTRPIIMYGTSILQGGCASRPGMCHSSILERMLDREVINLGFSGNGKLDIEIAKLIASCPDPGLIVLEPLPNLKTQELKERMIPFYEVIRKSHPTVPIVFVESPLFPLMRFNNETNATITEKNQALADIFKTLKKRGDKNIAYFYGKDILGDNPEATVDNYHLTDLGFINFANAIYPLLKKLLLK